MGGEICGHCKGIQESYSSDDDGRVFLETCPYCTNGFQRYRIIPPPKESKYPGLHGRELIQAMVEDAFKKV